MTLPALRAWAPWLSGMLPELAAALSPLVARLSAAVGPMVALPSPGGAEPNGYNDLSRTGSYERLLTSEWLLAEEAPDEFVRRAAMGEHLFLRLDRRTPVEGRRCAVLFDAGPEQLGNPRLAQLALLLVMARRASEARAALVWGVLQAEVRWSEGADPAGCRALLAARSARDPTEGDLTRWLDALDDRGPHDELWLISGTRHAGLGRGAAPERVLLDEPLFTPDLLTARVARPRRTGAVVELPLPASELRARLVRDPFGQPASPQARRPIQPMVGEAGPVLEMVLSSEGHRLLCLESSSVRQARLLAFAIPSRHDRARGRQPKAQATEVGDERPIAAGWFKQRLATLWQKRHSVVIDAKGTWQEHSLPLPQPRHLVPVVVATHTERSVAVWGSGAQGWYWWPLGEEIEKRPGILRAVARRDGRLVWVVQHASLTLTTHRGVVDLGEASGAWLSVPANRLGLVGLRRDNGLEMLRLDGKHFLHLPLGPDEVVHGIGVGKVPFALVSDGAGNDLHLRHRAGRVALSREAVRSAASCGPHAAFLTDDGRVTVVDANEGFEVALVVGGG